MRHARITPEFVEFVPEILEEGKLYISQTYGTAVHKCCCGCGQKVVTPLNPTGWTLTIDGDDVSLHPSIGNWGFPCQSHYWIRRNLVQWSYQMTEKQIDAGRRHDARLKERYFAAAEDSARSDALPVRMQADTQGPQRAAPSAGFWQTLKRWLFG